MTLRSKLFDDIYFSAENGLEETRHVFLHSTGLPDVWRDTDRFVIAETGFGTGLNFLAAWSLFNTTARPGQRLDYVSFEKYPLSGTDIAGALQRWRDELGDLTDRLIQQYPLRIPGFHRLVFDERVRLTLIFDDVNEALPQLDVPGGVDAWFLDGFAPAKNPEMWSETVFREMARLSRTGTAFATFTAAGTVRRGLEQAGFAVEKRSGFGRKRDMLAGHFAGTTPQETQRFGPSRIAILGGGLAGTSCARVLKESGVLPVIFETAGTLAAGASGNERGLYNPRLSTHRTAESDYFTAGFALAVRMFRRLQAETDIGWTPCGNLHFITDGDRERKLSGAFTSWGWHAAHMSLMDAQAASEAAGVKCTHAALFLPDAGMVSPRALCHAYAKGIEVRLSTAGLQPVVRADGWIVGGENFDAVILANGIAAAAYGLPLHTVRGQTTLAIATQASSSLRSGLCFGGYMTPARAGFHMIGATFQKWLPDAQINQQDDRDNIERLSRCFPELAATLQPSGSWAALRAVAKDRLPVAGAVPGHPGLYVSTGHGSHGIVSSLAAAHLIADMMTGAPPCLPRRTRDLVDPARFTGKSA